MIDEAHTIVVAEPVAVAAEPVVEAPVAAHPAHSALEALEAEWARFHAWFNQKIAEIRSQL